ncbi:dipeptidase PepE [Campylobacter upsaliensis]|uniref:dipeptidase PepE n=1 Tax=Campylobacter upsaliensis TaxID=28080 RepID=UPI00127E7F02|nr:dipeptidase PepE [Campylobacter upsaliensis]EAH9285286.1 dipeptidase PepE [Campylobacter upsaliensis]EAI7278818.1 dipeptidase PepE [Campylobacter upsaliensis]EAI9131350.1 dipeptidase PepE [Campylobacter upsaliensis]EAJ7576192.1 dipeptidase PepE [Campylobacter upsaliensis]EAL0498046.1 dipeptidase PepE [Campylobacter upsaliensis]
MKRRMILKVGVASLAALCLSVSSLSAKEAFNFPKDKQKALLLSSSGYKDTGYLNHALPWLKEFVEKNKLKGKKVAFIPYAGVRKSYDAYEAQVKKALESLGVEIISVHKGKAADIVKSADAIFVGGGNTFELVNQLYKNKLVELIAKRVSEGVPYVGWSAGSNVAGATMQTTNDMPITEPESFNTFNIFPHQINPHFISGKPVGHNGESREERLEEFLILNPKSIVYALPEGVALLIDGKKVKVLGMDKKAPLLKLEHKKDISKIAIDSEFDY